MEIHSNYFQLEENLIQKDIKCRRIISEKFKSNLKSIISFDIKQCYLYLTTIQCIEKGKKHNLKFAFFFYNNEIYLLSLDISNEWYKNVLFSCFYFNKFIQIVDLIEPQFSVKIRGIICACLWCKINSPTFFIHFR
jgi:hypothetical protein